MKLSRREFMGTAPALLGAAAAMRHGSCAAMPPKSLTIRDDGYFVEPAGALYLPIGGFYGNFVHKVEDGHVLEDRYASIRESSEEEKRAWFQALKDHGVNCLRIMSRDHAAGGVDEWDIVGAVNEPLLRDWEAYWDLAREYGLSILPTLHESYYATYAPYRNPEVMAKMVRPHYEGADLETLPEYRRRFLEGRALTEHEAFFTDPDMLAVQRDYVHAIIPRLKDNPSIPFYELENEQYPGFYEWTNKNIGWIRDVDSDTPIGVSHSGNGVFHADPLPHFRNTGIDFYSFHLYPVAETTAEDLDYGAAMGIHARYARMCGPSGVGESGSHILANGPTGAWRRALARDTIWMPFLSGANHLFFWDAAHDELRACKEVAEVAGLLGAEGLKRKRPAVAIDVSHPLDDDLFFRSEAGKALYANLGRYEAHFMGLGVEFDHAVEPGGHDTLLPGERFEPYEPAERPFTVGTGYELRHHISADERHVVIYLRNRGTTAQAGEGWHSGWLRKPKAASLDVELRLPGVYRGFLHAFEAGNRRDVTVDGEARITDVESEDDYFVYLERG